MGEILPGCQRIADVETYLCAAAPDSSVCVQDHGVISAEKPGHVSGLGSPLSRTWIRTDHYSWSSNECSMHSVSPDMEMSTTLPLSSLPFKKAKKPGGKLPKVTVHGIC